MAWIAVGCLLLALEWPWRQSQHRTAAAFARVVACLLLVWLIFWSPSIGPAHRRFSEEAASRVATISAPVDAYRAGLDDMAGVAAADFWQMFAYALLLAWLALAPPLRVLYQAISAALAPANDQSRTT